MNIKHCLFLSCVRPSPESHEQDGGRLSRITARREPTASGDPAMAFRTLPCRKRRSLSALAKYRPRLSPPVQSSECHVHSLHETHRAHTPCAEQIIGGCRGSPSNSCSLAHSCDADSRATYAAVPPSSATHGASDYP